MFLNTLIALTLIIFVYIYLFYKNAFQFFEKRNIPYVKPNIIFGNLTEVILKKKTLFEVHAELYRKIKPQKVGGFFNFHKPCYMICDPELIKNIVIKNFEHFTDRYHEKPEQNFVSSSIGFIRGEKWKNFRMKLTPTYSSGKLKMMFPLMKDCGDNLARVLDRFSSDEEIEYSDFFARYITDVAATCAFGVETNALEDEKSEIFQLSRQATEGSILSFVIKLVPKILPTSVKIFLGRVYAKSLTKYFKNLVLETMKYRETNKIIRRDLLDLLIGLKNDSDINKFQDEHDAKDLNKFLSEIGNKHGTKSIEITDKIVVDQVFLFFFVSVNIISSALSCALLELALNPEIQNRVRKEITTVLKNNGIELTYEMLKEMKYTDMVIAETLRKHPSSASISRICTRDYNVPGTDIIIKKDESIVISVYGLHMDEEYFAKPDKFDPDRFTDEAKAKRVPFSYLAFGEGPRMCIASRFSKVNMKMGLIYMLKNHSFSVSPRTILPTQYQCKAARNHFLDVEGGVWLKCKKI